MPLNKFTAATGFSELLSVKNISGVIRALPLDVRLWVVGDGGEREKLEALAKKLKREVKFWGRVDNKAARKIMCQCGVFVLNSFHEGLSHAMLEALSEKVPVIATKIPAVTEVLKDRQTGLLVEVNNEADLREKIVELRDNPKLRQKLAANGRKLYIQSFTWAKHLEKLEAVFDQLLQK